MAKREELRFPSREDVASDLGRRVSKGEYERMFSALRLEALPTARHGIDPATGGPTLYHPTVARRVERSPKAERK